ncbi:hypothetical protein WOLCODRAFT_21973 [Wolfiporia cocos MD-104 SS10]|uniref:ARM repeat-containing protein n=1 Tax=Wolfiporia cocos (strain MD-104) TaxID=742152 RepID=A0A2H3ITT1_WOLCO|nr:hypothetical protein WOLCODRAFT_21973 [Wolfiporia cocos MD-104 SS10]
MEEDDVSMPDSPAWDSGTMTPGHSATERQKASLQSYLDSLPYECESVEEMQSQLEFIVSRISICAEARNWLSLTTWDGMLQCWLLMHYPMPKTTRAKLVRLYYECCLVPGLEPRVVRSWADMLSRLLSNKPDRRRKLEVTDLQLPWQPLWRALQKELWPKKRLHDDSRNMINILLYVAEQCQRYFPASDISEMLNTFLPRLTKETVLIMMPVMTSFLPPTHTHLYLPALWKIWESFNSSLIDDRMIDLCGKLSEEHIAGQHSEAGPEGAAAWKDVGLWTHEEWNYLAGKTLSSMHVPVGAIKGASTTASHADYTGDKQSLRIKKPVNRANGLGKLFVYSMCLDGPVHEENSENGSSSLFSTQSNGFLAGSRALDSLNKFITSTESYFHPSNHGPWCLSLTLFLHRLTAEFSKRWKEEQDPHCKTPVTRRLTPDIRRAFVMTLRTPALLAMFSKDPFSIGYAQAALRSMAFIEPNLVMPELLERAYSGLEVVNETHRTTTVMTMLAAVAQTLVSEKVWLGGQKHVVPLLELCVPGIDLNDPMKTICACMCIASIVQYIKIGDISMQQGGAPLTSDAPAEELMEVDGDNDVRLPDGTEIGSVPVLSREEERALAKESTAGFTDWVISLFRRVLALYENLPEEGGKRNTTGGKMEENVLKSIKSMLDIVCLHLSEPLFDLVLRLVYDYATTNAKSNAVRAFGHLVSCLARVKPEKVIDKFLPYCKSQIQEELRHGASSIRTTSMHASIPSDTTLHWNISILRGCFGHGGATSLKHKKELMELISLLLERTKSERGYSAAGRLFNRIVYTLTSVYPMNGRFVNSSEWDSPDFDRAHISRWGCLYDPEDVKLEWHVPSQEGIDFVIDILDQIVSPALDKLESLIQTAGNWDNVARNDFCRYLHAARSIWSGLPSLIQEGHKDVVNPCLYEEHEVSELIVSPLLVNCGFALTNSQDPRYQKVLAHRTRFGEVIHRAAVALRQPTEGEDHVDALVSLSKAVDVYLLEYALTRGNFDSLRKAYAQSRDATRMWPKQRTNARMVLVRRAHAYHAGRVYMHALYRRRSRLDDELLLDLAEMSLSPYTRLRKHAQAVLYNACGYYVRSTRLILPPLFSALARGSDPDRMKGALYMLWNKGIASYALADVNFHGQYLMSLLQCQHQEKPSIQKLVSNLAQDTVISLTEEAVHTDAFVEEAPGVAASVADLKEEYTATQSVKTLLEDVLGKVTARAIKKNQRYSEIMDAILTFASKPATHWRYVQFATRFLFGLLRRDVSPSPALASFFLRHSISPHQTIRLIAQKGFTRVTCHIKIRTLARSSDELWLDEWKHPLRTDVDVSDPSQFLESLQRPVRKRGADEDCYVDKIPTGFIAWTRTVKAYRANADAGSPYQWETSSQPALTAMAELLKQSDFIPKLILLWSQESGKKDSTPDLRADNIVFMKSLAKTFEHEGLDSLLAAIEPLLTDSDRFKQRAGVEILSGLLRGSKHWAQQWSDHLSQWLNSRLHHIYSHIKPDTIQFWEGLFSEQLVDRDPRRAKYIVDWVLSLPLEFHGDSALAMSKTLSFYNVLIDCLGLRFLPLTDRFMHLFLDNANTGYAEIRTQIAQNLCAIVAARWRPTYPSVQAFLDACENQSDTLQIKQARYMDHVQQIVRQLPTWRQERLPPPRVSQSQYDKVGLTVLQWIWEFSHSSQANLILPYAIALLPETLRMSELSDNPELQKYSAAVLYVLSAVTPSAEDIGIIAEGFIASIKSSTSWRVRVNALPTLLVFYYRNLMSIPGDIVSKFMEVLLECLADENVEVREMAAKMLSSMVRCSQRQSLVPLRDHFLMVARRTKLLNRSHPSYAEALRTLHTAILGLCALIESFPYSVEPWMPPLTDTLANHATDPAPISTTIRKCASEFKKTHQDTWHKDQHAFDEDQLQNLSTMLVGTSYYA